MGQVYLIDIRQGAELIVVGGVPRSGKTLMTGRLWDEHRVPGMCMDGVVTAFERIAPEAGIGFDETLERAQKILTAAQMVAIPSLNTFGRYFIEGESLTPIVADALRKNFQVRACFMSLDHPHIEDIIRYEGIDAWVRNIPPSDYANLEAQIADRSRWLRDQCEVYGFKCVDMTRGEYRDRVDEVIGSLLGSDITTGATAEI